MLIALVCLCVGVALGLLLAWRLHRVRSRLRDQRQRTEIDDRDRRIAALQVRLVALDAQLLAARAEQSNSRGNAAQATAQSTVVEGNVQVVPQAAEPREPHLADDLTRIRGVGPKLAALLQSLGIVRFAQIAAFDAADLERLDDKLGAFKGRAERDDWVGQAATLAESD